MRLKTVAVLVFVGISTPGMSAESLPEAIERFDTVVTSGASTAEVVQVTKELASAAMANPESELAGPIAFEAGWSLCQLGSCGQAREVAAFALQQPSGDSHPTRASRAVLKAYADWSIDQSAENREALEAAAEDLVPTSPGRFSVNLSFNWVEADLEREDFAGAETSGSLLRAHLEPTADTLGDGWLAQSLMIFVARYGGELDAGLQRRMVELEGRLKRMRQRYERRDMDAPEWLSDAYWQVSVHGMAFHSALRSQDKPTLTEDEFRKRLQAYELPLPAGKVPTCEVDYLRPPKPRYPRSFAREGYVGAAIIGGEIGTNGPVSYKVLASIPNDEFGKAAQKSMKTVRWERKAEADSEPCEFEGREYVYPFSFELED